MKVSGKSMVYFSLNESIRVIGIHKSGEENIYIFNDLIKLILEGLGKYKN